MSNDKYNTYNFRPRIKEDIAEKLRRLSNEYNIESTKIINFLVSVGVECMERSFNKVEDDIKQKFEMLLKDLK